MGDQEKMDRINPSLKKFSGSPIHFMNWAKHLVDHMHKVHPVWRSTLEWCGRTDEPLNFARLNSEKLGPFNEHAGELAMKLEQTICDWLPEKLYNRRVQLCGG